jgi:hypothetical protein
MLIIGAINLLTLFLLFNFFNTLYDMCVFSYFTRFLLCFYANNSNINVIVTNQQG